MQYLDTQKLIYFYPNDYLLHKTNKFMVISVTNLKGGVGKSTVAQNMAVGFAHKKHEVVGGKGFWAVTRRGGCGEMRRVRGDYDAVARSNSWRRITLR